MNVDDFKRVESIFEAALKIDEDKREAHVQDLCGSDDALYRRVLRMLDHATKNLICDDLEQFADDSSATTSTDELIGTRIGRYLVQERIGEGGFGAVYRAKQLEPVTRTVALKLIKLGMDTEKVIARFEAERQALAMMDHPHIARVFDAGATETGRPYFVMELVHGMPITRFCDEHELSIEARLRLFILVCQAIHHAHQKGVIHRDVKPSNVLVRFDDGRAVPKVIDFGIAKATQGRLTDRTLITEHRAFIGTPEYMSPEQAGADVAHIDTRTDIYSLGVLLYELMVGVTPFQLDRTPGGTPEDLLRHVRESDPRKPSSCIGVLGDRGKGIARKRGEEPETLRRQLQGDLDWIVLAAIEKDPERRYESAAELAHEIERYLNNEPIIARPPGPLYLTSKFVRRNQVTVTAAIVITLTLVVGLIVSVAGLNEARHAHWQAEQAFELAQRRLFESLQAQAEAARNSDQIGRRFQALRAIAHAAQIEPSAALRDSAIASMSLQDFEVARSYPSLRNATSRGLRTIDRFAHIVGPGELHVEFTDGISESIRLTTLPKRIWFNEFSDDAAYVAAKLHDQPNEAHIVVWDLESGEEVLLLDGLHARDHFSFSRMNGRHVIAVARDGLITVHSLPNGENVHTLQLPGRSTWIVGDPRSERLAVSQFSDRMVSIWSLRGMEQQVAFSTSASIRDMAWHPDGTLLAGCGGDYRVYIWDVATGEEQSVLIGHEGVPVEVYFSSDGSVLATYGWDATTRLWNLKSGEPLFGPLLDTRIAGLSDAMLTVDPTQVQFWRYEPALECQRVQSQKPFGPDLEIRFSNCGTLMLTAGENGVRLWDTNSLRELAVIMPERAVFADFSADDSSIIAASANIIQRWAIDRTDHPVRIADPELILEKNGLRGCDIDYERQRLAFCTDTVIEIVDLTTRTAALTMPAYAGASRSPLLDPTGRWLFLGCWRGSGARLWDIATGMLIREFPGSHVVSDFSPDGRYLLVSTAESFETYSTETWASIAIQPRGWSGELAGLVSFSRGRSIAATMHTRFEIHLVDLDTGALLAQLSSPRPAAMAGIAVSNDGTKVAAATATGLLLIWDLDRIGQRLLELGLDWSSAASVAP